LRVALHTSARALHATKKAAVANQIFFAIALASTKEKRPAHAGRFVLDVRQTSRIIRS
jgi:hypothetical protein